jgi:hypothetical protein
MPCQHSQRVLIGRAVEIHRHHDHPVVVPHARHCRHASHALAREHWSNGQLDPPSMPLVRQQCHNEVPVFDALAEYHHRGHTPFTSPGHKHGRGADTRVRAVLGEDVFRNDLLATSGLDDRSTSGEVTNEPNGSWPMRSAPSTHSSGRMGAVSAGPGLRCPRRSRRQRLLRGRSQPRALGWESFDDG